MVAPEDGEVAELPNRLVELERENAKLHRINAALIERIESSSSGRDASYAAFQHSVVLAEQVRERTDALNQTMAELKASNRLLSDARLRAETAHQLLVDAIESISDAFVLFDKDQRIVLFNRRFKSLWNRTGARIHGGTRLADMRRLAESSGLIAEEHRGKGNEPTVYRLHTGRWVQVSERPTREGGLVMLYTDITEVKISETMRREQALAQKSRLLQRAVDNLSQGVAMISADGSLELWNRRFLELCGLAPIEAHRPFEEVMADSELKLLTPGTRGIGGQPLTELEQHLFDGRTLEIRTHPLPTGGFVNTFTDITERYRHAEALRESERWIRLITDHVPALIAYVSADLTYAFTNKVYEEWYRWPRDGMLGQCLRDIHSGEHWQQLEPYIDRALSGESISFEMAEPNHAGQQRYMLRSYVPNRLASGEVAGIFVLIQDITDRRRTAEALHQAYQNLEQRVRERTAELTSLNEQLLCEIDERAHAEARLREAKREAELANLSKTKFLAAVSHDLLQPLNAARLFTSALLEQATPSGGLIRNISNSLEDVENLLGTLVDISKLDAGVIKPDIASFAVSELLENLAVEFRQIAGTEALRLDYIPSTALVRSDIQLLARILRNLLTNAIRYTPTGRVLLGCRRRRQSLSIEVWDTGVGIAEDKLEEVFQEFKRGDAVQPSQDRGLGLGLGLAIVEKIARMLGHRILVRSQPGRGSVFAVEVPLARRISRSRVESPSTELLLERLRGARVWVIDNDAAICAGMRTLLEGWGCVVTTALSEEDLARQVDNFHADADLIIADYHLDNGCNGLDVVTTVNERRAHSLPVLLITANYSNDLKLQVRELGHMLMHKPIRPMKLKTAMCHMLEHGHAAG